MKPKSKVLIIAGSDSSGGAGIQADIKTVTALGSYAMTAVTAVTCQNTKGVKSITAISTKNLRKQIVMVLDDIGANALKIGMLHNTGVIKCIYKILKKYKIKNIVNLPRCKVAIKKAKKIMSSNGRLLIRKSGTEPKIRIMAESYDKSLILKCIKIIKSSINK